jgi:putative nucleotidyltransferase with HDIG domain
LGIRYRAWQTWQFLTAAPLNATAWSTIEAQLTPAELLLFQAYRPSDRRHAYRVMCALQKAGHHEPALLTAALLHDVGKTRLPLSIGERVLVVLGWKLLPGRAAEWSKGNPAGWQRAFVIKARHAEWGAEMAAQAGSHPQVVDLIRRHQEPLSSETAGKGAQLLRLLQWADDRS